MPNSFRNRDLKIAIILPFYEEGRDVIADGIVGGLFPGAIGYLGKRAFVVGHGEGCDRGETACQERVHDLFPDDAVYGCCVGPQCVAVVFLWLSVDEVDDGCPISQARLGVQCVVRKAVEFPELVCYVGGVLTDGLRHGEGEGTVGIAVYDEERAFEACCVVYIVPGIGEGVDKYFGGTGCGGGTA